jgi:hypothetical protein
VGRAFLLGGANDGDVILSDSVRLLTWLSRQSEGSLAGEAQILRCRSPKRKLSGRAAQNDKWKSVCYLHDGHRAAWLHSECQWVAVLSRMWE